ncbi:MAG TPA: copper chaperone PCu(A)C [Streptosporangiaceae bacterium]|nr:copper chaperone PCu(A)C [Streptosporangiaceae bacterium]
MIRSSYGRTLRRLMIGGVALLVPILAGCEAGNGAPVLQFHPAAAGAQGTTDSVTISDAFILGGSDNEPLPAGSSASMFLSVYNGGNGADKLVGIDATGSAKSVQLSGGTLPIPAQNMTDLEGPRPKVVLRGLTKALNGGQTVKVLLTFANAGSVELTVPVESRTTYYSSFSPPAPTPSATKRIKVGATSPVTGTATPGSSASATATPTPSATP